MKILFICKHNRFRSKIAEAFFKKLNKNKKIKAKSVGLFLDPLRPYIEKNVINIMKKRGYNIKRKPKQATNEFIKKFDLIIIVADNVDKKSFSDINVKIIKWKISDCDASDIKSIKRIVNQIENKVKILITKNGWKN
jgi:protein-tyrosine-phosphatase